MASRYFRLALAGRVEHYEDSDGVSEYTGLEDGGIMTWEIPADMAGYCFTLVDPDKVVRQSLLAADGSTIVEMPNNVLTSSTWAKEGNELCLTLATGSSRAYVPLYRADVGKWTTVTSMVISDQYPKAVKFTFDKGAIASNVYATDRTR